MIPNEAFKNIVNNKMGLKYDQKQCHVGEGKLTKLKFVMAFLEI
jgi:hypothetical protein